MQSDRPRRFLLKSLDGTDHILLKALASTMARGTHATASSKSPSKDATSIPATFLRVTVVR